MPDSNYTTTPPTATEMQILAMGDKVNDICKNVEKLSQRMEDIPLKLDRLSTSIETLSRESAENRSALERTRNNFEQDLERAKHELSTEIEKIKGDIATKEKDLNETLKPLIKSETKVTTIFAIVAAWDTFTDGLSAYFKEAWNNIVENAKELASDVKDTGGSIADFGYSVMDKTLAAMGNKDAQARVEQRERGEIGHQAENYQAKTTHDAPTPWQATKDAAGKLLEQPVVKEQAISKDQKKRMEQVYQSAIGAGFSHRQAVALVGEVGRENDFNPNNMFGSHKDPARGNNLGIFSWQGKRREALQKHMADRGFMNKDGTIQRSQAALQAQFEFAKQEMASNKKWKEGFLDKKEITIDQARPQLGGKGSYVGWALGQTTIRKADGSRVPFDYKSQLNKANSYSATVEKISAAEAKAIQPAAKIPNVAVPATSPAIVKPMASTPARPVIQPTITPRAPVQAAASRSNTTAGVTPPKLEPIKIESFSERITSPAPQEVVVVNQNNDTIGQNVSDRGLAHAFTGGIGFNQG